ncbi:Guanine nucleotide exchange factor [Phaffia rhodozyma]|uniref:Guanine nucleotide exchange factor n=1 Tax=Phaffia rhodozyma TaxID=264483 RepID=A0A0F7SRX2_PHARH|nr:Guanine nucleotide exchange factor [Phaffia rhodozyma]
MARTVASYSQPPSSPKQNTHRFSAFDFGSRKRNTHIETALGLTLRPNDSQRSGTADDNQGSKKEAVDPSAETYVGRRSITDSPTPLAEDTAYNWLPEKRVGGTVVVAAAAAPAPSPTRSQSLTSRSSRRRSRTLSSYLAFDKHDDRKDRHPPPNLQSNSTSSSSTAVPPIATSSSNHLSSGISSSSSLASSSLANRQGSSAKSMPTQSSSCSLLSDPSLSETAVAASASSSSSSTPFESDFLFHNKYPSLSPSPSPSPSKNSLSTYHPRPSQPGSLNSDSSSSPSLNRKQYFLLEPASVPSSKDPTPLRRPSLFSLKATGTSTTVVGRLRDSIFGTHSVFHPVEPDESERKYSGDVASRESSTYKPSSKRNSKTSDADPLGLLGNLRPPNLRTRSSSSIPSSILPSSPVSIPMPIPPTPTRDRRLNRPRSITSPPLVDLSLLNPVPSPGLKLFRPDSLRRRSSGVFSSSGASSPQPGISPLNGRSPMASPRRMSSFLSSSAGSSGSSAMTAGGDMTGGMMENLSTPVIGENTESIFGFRSLRSNSINGSNTFLPIPSPSIPIHTSPIKRGTSLLRRRSSTTSSSGSWTPAQVGGSGTGWNRDVPIIREKGSPEEWLRKLLEAVPRCEVATVLASSGDEFHASALKTYLSSFDLSGISLDIALRQLLMEVSLPKETQQIDRVMEAFARQYIIGNPGLFVSKDHPYILAFSLIMLHTDAFNKSNKNKMTKADYVRNTRMDGVNPLVLDTFFDNITFTPFVFIEDDMDVNGQRALLPESSHSANNNASSIFSSSYNSHTIAHFGSGSSVPSNSSILAGKTNKIDVYYLISQNLTHTLRASVEPHIPTHNPFSYVGPKGYLDTNELQTAFSEADMIMIAPAAAVGSTAPGGRKGSAGLGFGISGTKEDTQGPADKGLTLKLTKFGLLSRKEDLIEGGKKASNRRWKEWSVILTGSQLLFFKDPTWALVLRNQAEEARVGRQAGEGGKLLLPKMTSFKPDEVLSVKDCIAVMETSYNKYSNTFRFIMPHGRQYLLQAGDDDELNEWITRINYAAAFKTASVRMRGMGMTGNQAQWAGAAAAASHAKSLKMEDQRSVQSTTYTSRTLDSGFFSSGIAADKSWSAAPSEILSTASPSSLSSSLPASRHFGPRLRSLSRPLAVDLESPLSPVDQGPEQLQTAFIEVKAELAAENSATRRVNIPSAWDDPVKSRARSSSVNALKTPRSSFEKVSGVRADLREFGNVRPRSEHASRAEAIQLKVDNLLSKIASTEAQLKIDLRTAHNLSILAPFKKATRERIQLAVPPLARKIRHLRIELARFRCYEEILSKDLRIEADEWKLVKHIAHQAARSSLSGYKPNFQADSPKLTVPGLEISMHTDFSPSDSKIDLVRSASTQSSTGSFHSAAEDPIPLGHFDSTSDLPVPPPKDGRPIMPLGAPFLSKPLDSPLPPPPPTFLADTKDHSSSSPNALPILIPDSKGPPGRASLDHPLPALPASSPKSRPRALSDAEESPEEWSSTRAAHSKRISLAEVPTETVRRISLQLKRDSIENIRARAKLVLTPSKVSEVHVLDEGDDTLIASRGEEGDVMSEALSSLLL